MILLFILVQAAYALKQFMPNNIKKDKGIH